MLPSLHSRSIAEFGEGRGEQVASLADRIRIALGDPGYIVIRGYGDGKAPEQAREDLVDLCRAVGVPASHDAAGTIVWDIKTNERYDFKVITYSEHHHEADFHTDSQYSRRPEHHFALLALRRARCGGGQSYILALKDILADLRSRPDGADVEHVLRTTEYPFIVPNVFKHDVRAEREYNFGPILTEEGIRFRMDTLEIAMDSLPDACTAEQRAAYDVLKGIIRDSPHARHFFLDDGDLMFINNQTMLHGRSSFEDMDRHLLRVRLYDAEAPVLPTAM